MSWGRRLRIGLFCSLFAAGAPASAQQSKFLEYLPTFRERTLVSGIFKHPAPRFDDLIRDQNQFRTPEELVAYLIKKSPRLKSNFVLMHNSESQQLSSLEHPRTILFEGGMAYGFSEHPDQRVPRVEILEVDPATYRVDLHEILFEPGRGPKFERSPKACATCHGSPAKPLWNPYDFWPNAFASAIGEVSTEEERDSYKRLHAQAPKSPILRQLALTKEISRETEHVTAFTQYVNGINVGRWVAENLTGPEIDAYFHPLAAVLGACTSKQGYPEEIFDDRLLAHFRKDELRSMPIQITAVASDLRAGRNAFKSHLDAILERIFPNPRYVNKVYHPRMEHEVGLFSQAYWIFDLAGIDATNLSPSLIGNDTLISSPSNAPIDFLTSIYERRPDLFAKITWEPMDIYGGNKSWIKVDCAQLKKLSLAQARTPSPRRHWRGFEELKHTRPVLSRCAKCHVERTADGALRGPAIPFDRPLELARLIRDPSARLAERIMERVRDLGGASQMPPGPRGLSREEIESLEEFLEVLK